MPPIPKHIARITPQPVGKAPLPVSAADVGAGAIGAGLQRIGKGVGDIGNILLQIKQDQIAQSDSISETKADALIRAENDDFARYMLENDLILSETGPSNWETESTDRLGRLGKSILDNPVLPLSNNAQNRMNSTLDAFGLMRESRLRLLQTESINKNSKITLPLGIEKAYASGDDLLIERAKLRFEQNRERTWGADQATADRVFQEAITSGQKEFYENIGRQTLNKDEFIDAMQKKKLALDPGGKDEQGLDAKDFDDIIASTYNSKALAEKSLDERQQIELDELGQALVDGTIDWTLIKNKVSLTAEQRESYRQKMNNEAKRKAEAIPIRVNQPVKSNLEGMAYDITSGAVTMEEFKTARDEARYPEDGNPTIDDDVYDELTSLAERKFESYQSGAMRERETFALGQLVTHPSELGFAERLRQLTSQFEKDQAQVLRQLQFDNHDQYKKALRDLLKTKPDADADWIFTEGRKLLKHYRKSPDQLRKEAETLVLPPATNKEILDAARQVESDIKKGLATKDNFIRGPLNNPQFVIKNGNPEMLKKDGKEVGLKLQNGTTLKVGSLIRQNGVIYKYIGGNKWQKQ